MDLLELIDPEYGLQQDEWSLTAPKFGNEGQLTVIGWSGRLDSHKLYIMKCSICSQDSELFDGGYFKSAKNNLTRGAVPCGCSKKHGWSKEQYFILCLRKAEELCYKFLGFAGDWKGAYTKIKMLCEKHGEWDSGSIDTLTRTSFRGCPSCKNAKPDDFMIASFFASGAFHPETVFKRSERLNTEDRKPFWFVHCTECGETGEARSTSLQFGSKPCACSKQRQQECYINLVIDGESPLAIKFGIARDSKKRLKAQSSKSFYTIKLYSIYTFPNVSSCKQAERECKKELECGVVLRRDMKDGWTETTHLYNLEKIIEIYERNGGIRIE